MAKYLGRGACEGKGCGKAVEVYADRNGLAYYKCGPCQRKVTHFSQRESAKFVATIDRHAEEDEAPAPAKGPALDVPAAVLDGAAQVPARKGMFGFGGK